MPVLKIDRTFIARLPDDASAASMATAMLEPAERLGMRVVAEGIETVEQLEFLIDRGCPLGQGYLFSRPVPQSRWRGYRAWCRAGGAPAETRRANHCARGGFSERAGPFRTVV